MFDTAHVETPTGQSSPSLFSTFLGKGTTAGPSPQLLEKLGRKARMPPVSPGHHCGGCHHGDAQLAGPQAVAGPSLATQGGPEDPGLPL